MYDKSSFHLMIASDANYAEFVSVVLASLFDTNGSLFNEIHIHLFSNGIPDEAIAKISLNIAKENGFLHVYDISHITDELNVSDNDTMPISAYARLLLTKYIDDSINRILYVDCDVVFSGSIVELWNSNLGDNWIAGVLDAHMDSRPKTMIGMPEDAAYVNSGVLLINLDAWRGNKIVDKFQQFIDSYNGLVYHQDQGIINGVCKGHILVLPPIYNAVSFFYSHPYKVLTEANTPFYSKAEIDEVKKNARIIHFTEGYLGRPWMEHCKHPEANVFWEYHRMTAWRQVPLKTDTRSFPLRFYSWMFLNLPYGMFCRITSILEKLK